MTKYEDPGPRYRSSTAYHDPPSSASLTARRASALGLIVLLFSAATPFTPVSWLIQAEGGFLFDRLFAGIALLAACYFQWRISGLTSPLAVALPLGPGETTVRNGRLETGRSSVGFVWRPADYWPYAVAEAVLLAVAEFGPSELLRRLICVSVVAGLWAVGWFATPRSVRMWAWGHIKSLWFWMILDEVMRVGLGRGGGGRQRRRY